MLPSRRGQTAVVLIQLEFDLRDGEGNFAAWSWERLQAWLEECLPNRAAQGSVEVLHQLVSDWPVE